MDISLNKYKTDKESIYQNICKYPNLYDNEYEFVDSMHEFLLGEKEKYLIQNHPIFSLRISNLPDIKFPVYRIQKYTFFSKNTQFRDYELRKDEIEQFTKWADNLDMHAHIRPIDQAINWENTLSQIFIDGQHFDISDLANNFNYIQRMILDHEQSLFQQLMKIKTSDDLVTFIVTFLNRIKRQYNDATITYCTKIVPQRIKVVCPEKLEQYYDFIELFLSKEKWLEIGINIQDRPIYNYLLPKKSEQPKPDINIKIDIDFQEIVLAGYFNELSRKNLTGYFLREFKKAEKEMFYAASDFFDGCLGVIKFFKKDLENQLIEDKRPFYKALKETPITDIKRRNQIKEDLKNITNNIGFSVNITNLTKGKYRTNFGSSDIETIAAGIKLAFEEVKKLDVGLSTTNKLNERPINTDILSIKEQEYIINGVNKDIINFLEEEKIQREDQIQFIEKQILAILTNRPKTPHRDFYIELLERHLARLNGTAAEKYIYKNIDHQKSNSPIDSIQNESYQSIESTPEKKTTLDNSHSDKNPHTKIFKDKFSFDLFELLQKSIVKDHPDYSYYYRRMKEDENNFIHDTVSESDFRRWLDENEIADIRLKLKTKDHCHSKHKELAYINAIDQLKSKSIR